MKATGSGKLPQGNKRSSFFGVDFSGAKDAGRKIWISHGIESRGLLNLEYCVPLEELAGTREREECHRFLCEFIASNNDAVFGLDFPFGLPQEITGNQKWEEIILQFPKNYPDAKTFREKCRKQTNNMEFKRRSEKEKGAPFSPYNLRLYRQTYYGIRNVIYPLVKQKLACVPPMQNPDPNKPWIAEICPACTLKEMGLYQPYKGKEEAQESQRILIVKRLSEIKMRLDESIKEKAINDSEGDALDSILATLSAYRFPAELGKIEQVDEISRTEGMIFY
ncbi:hypothetical protein J2755_002068 [Methanohalophilus levihalophilus]|uniref:DUF429 domain-containing protein n=1 Tax=Methanohalophilus levihalophilus TaxID=1431282 RepID=UPI001AE11A32|nr:DUF429 domain-containing protein [Methanohalophilus levihalophilus]MBP2031120.1 hypothetical protein [Methanohalophilus levihalophilus]